MSRGICKTNNKANTLGRAKSAAELKRYRYKLPVALKFFSSMIKEKNCAKKIYACCPEFWRRLGC